MDKYTKKLIKVFIVYMFVLAAFVILFKTIWMLNVIPSKSIEPTIVTGDIVFGTRYDVREGEIKRYDILVFTPLDEPDVTCIKRVIGLPGETIVVENGRVYADGVELDDDFIKNPMNRKGDGIYVVPEGCYFFLGDNRNLSKDSRFWNNKYVPIENIEGKAKFILFPFKNCGSIVYK